MNEEAEKNRKRVEIANALAALAIGDFPEKLRALADAVRAGEWEDIAAAAWLHERFDHEDEAGLHCVRWIATHPEVFGIKRLTKNDIVFLAGKLIPSWTMKHPRRTWKRLGLEHLPQGRGNEEVPELRMMAARERWLAEKRAEIAAIRGKPAS
jgi:hypothetical protein